MKRTSMSIPSERDHNSKLSMQPRGLRFTSWKMLPARAKRTLAFAACAAIGLAAVGLIVRPILADGPGLTLVPTNSNQFQLILTNTVPGETYVIYRRQLLDNPIDPWRFHLLGSPSQTVFTVDMGIETFAFFQAISGTNWDGDAAPNWEDANPLDPLIGKLSVTIDSPANGSNIQ